jgi:hypothetical protein
MFISHPMERKNMKVFENWAVRRMFRPRREKTTK